ncbi:hypothetical protein KDX30_01205 [Pseudomonas sp. CDFA 553]|uniref:hypothetical protein n=1 Tax=Pseudomonas quasicaspiana TaxID=2829821 RepID=UPI001E3730FA|nr:hypothetical protein [Pseudomonas quasicaspiana]MCD5986508.1 hypothetical protein [Pseudomonas quasicaspiana]
MQKKSKALLGLIFRKLPQSERRIILLLTGFLVISATGVSQLNIVVAGEYGVQELGHFIGFSGIVLGVTFAIESRHCLCQVLSLPKVALGLMVALSTTTTLQHFDKFEGYQYSLILALIVVVAGAAVLEPCLRRVKHLSPSAAAVFGCVCLSGVWELWIQPYVSVYAGPPRGFIEWPQIIADLAGLAVGLSLVFFINFKSGTLGAEMT